MRLPLCLVLMMPLLVSGLSVAQPLHLPAAYEVAKAENGLILAWKLSSIDPSFLQIGVYDSEGTLLVGLSPLKAAPEAHLASVYDVSGRRGDFIAVAVIYNVPGRAPAASLLYFDFTGRLLVSSLLDSSRMIMRLTIDVDSNVWTLITRPGGRNPPDAPLIVEYGPSGSTLKELFKESDFPGHEWQMPENPQIGVPGFGHTSDRIWFWLAGSTDLVTFKPDGSSIQRVNTGLPQRSPHEQPVSVQLTDEGVLIEQIKGRQENERQGRVDLFSRSPNSSQWEALDLPSDGRVLIGIDHDAALLSKSEHPGFEIDVVRMP